jgi:hypothetical protein
MNHQTPTTPTTPTARRVGESPLVVCAILMALLLGVLLSPLIGEPARAEMVAETGHLVTLTAKGGNEDILLVLDNRTEQLTLYKVDQRNALEMIQRVALPELFSSARARRLGGP